MVDVLLEVFFVFVFFLNCSHSNYFGWIAWVYALRCLLGWQVNHHDSRGKDGLLIWILAVPQHQFTRNLARISIYLRGIGVFHLPLFGVRQNLLMLVDASVEDKVPKQVPCAVELGPLHDLTVAYWALRPCRGIWSVIKCLTICPLHNSVRSSNICKWLFHSQQHHDECL